MVLSGFSGAGKGTVVKQLLQRYDNYVLSVSATTRAPRAEDREGVTYYFKTKEEFQQMIAEDAFLEWASYVDNYYGTPKAAVEANLAAGRDVILEIEFQGALQIREKQPEDVLLLFLTPPSRAELERRLVGRGSETPESIAGRLKQAGEEARYLKDYDYLVVNDDLDRCVQEVHSIIQAQHRRADRQSEFIEKWNRELV